MRETVVVRASTTVVDPAVVELLEALERATETLQDFQASVAYEKFDALTEGSELQFGRLLYLMDGDAVRLGVFFEEYVDAAGRSDKVEQRYVFADGWLCEADARRKQFIKRQIVAPGESFDPLKLGEGPLPLPIGQKKDEVLARFAVAAASVPQGRLLKSIDAEAIASGRVRPLRLVPRAGLPEAEEFARIDLYYDGETLLPVGVVAESPEGDRKTVRLTKIRRNAGIAPEERALLSVETPPPDGWRIDVRPWKE